MAVRTQEHEAWAKIMKNSDVAREFVRLIVAEESASGRQPSWQTDGSVRSMLSQIDTSIHAWDDELAKVCSVVQSLYSNERNSD